MNVTLLQLHAPTMTFHKPLFQISVLCFQSGSTNPSTNVSASPKRTQCTVQEAQKPRRGWPLRPQSVLQSVFDLLENQRNMVHQCSKSVFRNPQFLMTKKRPKPKSVQNHLEFVSDPRAVSPQILLVLQVLPNRQFEGPRAGLPK